MADSHPFDLLFLDPQRGGAYVASEMLIGAVWSSLYASAVVLALWRYGELSWQYDEWLTLWLAATACLRTIELPVELVLWTQITDLTSSGEDRRFTTRRLLKLLRGSGFSFVSKVGLLHYAMLLCGGARVWWQSAYGFPMVYQMCVALICFSTLKALSSVIRFHYEFAVAQRSNSGDAAAFLSTGATLEQIEDLPVTVVPASLEVRGVKLQGQSCAICIEEFAAGVRVKALRCSATHIFHQSCIDRWLIEMEACPLCTSDLQKKND